MVVSMSFFEIQFLKHNTQLYMVKVIEMEATMTVEDLDWNTHL